MTSSSDDISCDAGSNGKINKRENIRLMSFRKNNARNGHIMRSSSLMENMPLTGGGGADQIPGSLQDNVDLINEKAKFIPNRKYSNQTELFM